MDNSANTIIFDNIPSGFIKLDRITVAIFKLLTDESYEMQLQF